MKIVMISDVHCLWKKLTIPECDVLISAGDYSFRGEMETAIKFHKWMSEQPAKHKISVQGNHEVWVEKNWDFAKGMVEGIDPSIIFIDEGGFEIEGIKFWASAVTPTFYNWAWNVDRGPDIDKHWSKIPEDTQVLITHGPPYGILDNVGPMMDHLGCNNLLNRVMTLNNLRLHVFGHIHGGAGEINVRRGLWAPEIRFVNASMCDEQYKIAHEPRVFEFDGGIKL